MCDEKLSDIHGMYACLGHLEAEALKQDLRDCARFIRLARLELADAYLDNHVQLPAGVAAQPVEMRA